MQYHLNGYHYGDPTIQPAAPGYSDTQGPLPEAVDILIVGTGPAGSVLAAQLAQFPDITTRVIERRQQPLLLGQADGVSCRSVEMFEAFGLASTLINEAHWINESTFWSPDPDKPTEIIRTGLMQDVPDGLSEFPHVIVNQARMQEMLLDKAEKSASRLAVDYGYRAIDVSVPDDPADLVTVTLEETDTNGDGTGVTRTIKARYVVGCDGARSAVRSSIGRVLEGDAQNHAWGVMDALALTDFPDVRKKSLIRSAHGAIGQIPREGGHLVRYYVDLGDIPEGDHSIRDTSLEKIIEVAQNILHPYTFDVKDVAWWSVYEVGQRVANGFDDVDVEGLEKKTPRVFLAGDASHTHSAKAGQGMNVSMQDTFNLGWKLASVLQGRSPKSLLSTYSEERKSIAQELIDFDRNWSKMFATKAGAVDEAKVQAAFEKSLRYTAGLATRYQESLLIGDTAHQDLAPGFEVGMRFHSAPVIRVVDAKPVELGHTHEADGRWRLYAFADKQPLESESSAIRKFITFLDESPSSPVRRFSPADAEDDAVFDVRVVVQEHHLDVSLCSVPQFLMPAKGKFGLRDYHKVFSAERSNGRLLGNIPGIEATQDIYDLREINRDRGVLVVVRPDQYIAKVLPLDKHSELTEFFANFMLPQK